MRLFVVLAVLLGPTAFVLAADTSVERFGLFVGANQGLPNQPHLRWAITDAQKMASIMIEAGGIDQKNATVLGQPSRAQLLGAIHSLQSDIRQTKSQGQKAEFYFYYSGHSDERGLLLSGERLLYADLRQAITGADAGVTVAILDSCDSGAFTRAKGGERVQPFLTDLSSETTGYAFLTSSSETEASQESDLLGRSFFTYYFINGLRGAADTTGNRRVTLNEAYQYAFRETLAETEGTSAGAQHASYDFQLKGSGDLVIVDLTSHKSTVVFDRSLSGRIYVRDQKGTLVSELQKEAGQSLTVAIPSGTYAIRYRQGDVVRLTKVTVTEDNPAVVSPDQFVVETTAVNRLRGDGTTRPQNWLDLEVIPRADTPPDEDTTISLGAIGARVDTVRGMQASGVVSIADQVRGFQAGGAVTIAGPLHGAQAAGAAALADTVDGAQLAGAYARAADVAGFQAAGTLSVAQDLRGVQSSGVLNLARSVEGGQFGVVNVAKTVRGIQIGVFNYADDVEGVPLGVVSWIQHGIHEIAAGYDTSADGPFLQWTGGSKVFWTRLECGVEQHPVSGAGLHGLWVGSALGVRWDSGFVGLDFGAGSRWLNSQGGGQIGVIGPISVNRHPPQTIPYIDAAFRVHLLERLAVWAGPQLDLVDSRLADRDHYSQTRTSWRLFDLEEGTSSVFLGLTAGLTFKL